MFEKKCDEEVENLTSNDQHGLLFNNPGFRPLHNYSPFRPLTGTPSNPPSTRVTPLSMRRRSPSPVVTGNVTRARMRFESGGNSSTTGRTRFESGGTGGTSTPISRSGFESHSNNQTLPRTFRWNSRENVGSHSTINRFLSGTNCSPMPWKPSSSKNLCDSPYQRRRLDNNHVEGAAKFLSETLPNNTGSCKSFHFHMNFYLSMK